MDITSIGGLVFGIACILVGQALEGGHAGSLVQATAAIIVLGGTFGAVAVAMPMGDFIRGMKLTGVAFKQKKSDLVDLVRKIVELASIARRDGVLALEGQLDQIEDPFLKRAVGFLVDGVDASVAREALETTIMGEFEEDMAAGKFYEAAGGFAPTVGVLGAVLGLIHVMENLDDPQSWAVALRLPLLQLCMVWPPPICCFCRYMEN